MAIPTLKKCCCLKLKWGALIAALVDFILSAGTLAVFGDSDEVMKYIWYAFALVLTIHIICIILVFVSLCVPNKKLVIPYLITGIIRIILEIIFFILVCIKKGDDVLVLVSIIIGIVILVILWFVIYSWYKMLGGSADSE
ncbi:uncharacterized protein LOC122613814 [Drosophila teissieri]|uniref:uncharacterized protein LOC122613814 n=1 Tax=Drosophila teissieri TaxID=7243 RepID=UPI001CBA2047|nr:uncharacterized protein LOC122613814 [Drosophila teissieri]